ncbi:MAG: hypothetical protein H0V56_01760 [Chthoniobacterales bacterium]|nr:hypothetical protein [Chthoniobacterales bacterium]
MFRRAFLFLAVAAVFFSLGVLARPTLSRLKQQVRTPPPADFQVFDLTHYTAKRSHFATLRETRQVVLLGDSRVAFAEWSELLERSDTSNRGISGDTTSGVLRRLPASVPTSGVLCVIQVGVNDLILGGSVEQVVANYRRIVDYLRQEKNARVVITSVIPASEEQPELNRAVHECNQQLVQLAAASGAQWLDLGPSLSPEGFLRPEFRSDAVHLNGDGYLRLRDVLAPLLQP